MFRHAAISSHEIARACVKLVTLVLCLNLLVPLAWENPCAGVAQQTSLASRSGQGIPSLSRKVVGGSMPATLTEAPSVAPHAGLGRSSQRSSSSPDASGKSFWAALHETPRLPSLRIDPLVGDIVTPSFLLPSEHGLISFALPPPLVAKASAAFASTSGKLPPRCS